MIAIRTVLSRLHLRVRIRFLQSSSLFVDVIWLIRLAAFGIVKAHELPAPPGEGAGDDDPLKLPPIPRPDDFRRGSQ